MEENNEQTNEETNEQVWSIGSYIRDMCVDILEYTYGHEQMPKIKFVYDDVNQETKPQWEGDNVVIALPKGMPTDEFMKALHNGAELTLNSRDDRYHMICRLSIIYKPIQSYEKAVASVQRLNRAGQQTNTYYRLINGPDNNYIIMVCQANSLQEKQMIQESIEGQSYSLNTRNRILSGSQQKDAKTEYLTALKLFSLTCNQEVLKHAVEKQKPDDDDLDERALYETCRRLAVYKEPQTAKFKVFLNTLLSHEHFGDDKDEAITEFAKMFVDVYHEILAHGNDQSSIERCIRDDGQKNYLVKAKLAQCFTDFTVNQSTCRVEAKMQLDNDDHNDLESKIKELAKKTQVKQKNEQIVQDDLTINGIMDCIKPTIQVLNKPDIVVYNKNSDRADVRIKLLGFTTFKNPITGLSSHCAQCLVNGHVMDVLYYRSKQNNQKTVYIKAPNGNLLQLQLPSAIGQETTATIFDTKKYIANNNDDGKKELVAIQKPTPGTPGYVPIIPVVQPTIPVKNKLQPNDYSIVLSQQVTNDYNNNKPPFYDPNISNISTIMPTTTYVAQDNIVTNMNAINTNNQATQQSLQNITDSPILNTAPTYNVVPAEQVPLVNPGVTNIINTPTGTIMQTYDTAEDTSSYINQSDGNPLNSFISVNNTQTDIPVNQLQLTSVSTTAPGTVPTIATSVVQTTSPQGQSAYTSQDIANAFLSSDANAIDNLFRNAQNGALKLGGTTYTNAYNYNNVPINTSSPAYNTSIPSINMNANSSTL